MEGRVLKVAVLLAGSGMCALIYQMAWLREFRLVFGASTAASAAVLAIFMGGLGLGGALLGRWADRHGRPLHLYGNLELAIAASAAVSPVLIMAVRWGYIQTGGSLVLGLPVATVIRLVLSALVLATPTILMGGTLPAAARAVETSRDVGRGNLALLYGLNTLGAVCGAFVATFYMLELFGTRATLWLACLLNLLVALTARSLARTADYSGATVETVTTSTEPAARSQRAPAMYVYAAAAIVGFAFFLMELVWYRMLGPLLGGSTYTFGLILAVALLGIGLGGAAYSFFGTRFRPTLRLFAITVALEAVCMAVPFALGDRLAVLSAVLRDLSAMGFYGYIVAWSLVAGAVVLPAAIVTGFQFPLLIGLLGEGRENVGKETGFAYAWNTAGAIAGSLAGGFGLLPLLTAQGTWQAVVVLMLGLSAIAMALSARYESEALRLAIPGMAAAAALLLVLIPAGPTAAWRHSGIGAGRSVLKPATQTTLTDSINDICRHIIWETDGVESSVALNANNGLAFVVNGKIDGNAISDAPTQIGLGMISAVLHPNPRTSMVIGLGTGSSAGWLGAIPGMERVDVVELEPAIREVARRCTPVNEDVMNNPKVNVILGDGREILLTAPDQYDLIVSEPSNPYRAGIASLYTKEFYEAVSARLADGGVFSQWVQAYEIDTPTIRTIYATLGAVFPYIDTWQSKTDDLILLCSKDPIRFDAPELRKRVAEEPFRSFLLRGWRTEGLEGYLARFVAGHSLAELIASQETELNTDDRTLVEFGFGRTLGRFNLFNISEIRAAARARGAHRPLVTGGAVYWDEVEEQRAYIAATEGTPAQMPPDAHEEVIHRVQALRHFQTGNLDGMYTEWRTQPREPKYPIERIMVAEAMAELGADAALALIGTFEADQPADARVIRARYLWQTGAQDEAAQALAGGFTLCRDHPWGLLPVIGRGLELAQAVAGEHPESAQRLAESLAEPFSVRILEYFRRDSAFRVAANVSYDYAQPYVADFEPHVPWTIDFLRYRFQCYQATSHPLSAEAEGQLKQYIASSSLGFNDTLVIKEQSVVRQAP